MKNGRIRFGLLALPTVIAITIGASGMLAQVATPSKEPEVKGVPPGLTAEPLSGSTKQTMSSRDIARVAFKSVVLLQMDDSNGQPLSLGSGFFVSDGIIATNAHVIEGASGGMANLVGDTHTLPILGIVAVDRSADLALLKVASSAPSLALGPSTSPSVGDNVYVVGNPLGLEGTFSEGIISGVRHIDEDSVLQMSAPISPGSSGGPVMDSFGAVIGIAEATISTGQNLNFAVPVSYLSKLLATANKQLSVSPLGQHVQGDNPNASMFDSVVAGDVQTHHLVKIEQQGEALFKDTRYAEAEPLLAQACTGGVVGACSYLGSMYEKGEGVTKDYSKAVTLYTKSCDGGTADGCNGLGVMFANGKGVAKDDSKAVPLYTKACDAGSADGCNNLGIMYQIGRGLGPYFMQDCHQSFGGDMCAYYKDFPEAVTLYSKACDAGSADGCGNLGSMYLNGWGVTEDDSQALMLFSRACDTGSADGCSSIGNVYLKGYGVQKDKGKARQFFSKSCNMGYQLGCDLLKKLH